MVETLARDVIAEKVRAIAAAQAGVDPVGITEATHFQADLNYGSLDSVEFVMPLEDAFELSIADEQAEKVQVVGARVDLLCAALRAAGRGTGPAQRGSPGAPRSPSRVTRP